MGEEDEELRTLRECLRLSQHALERDPHQLPGQIVGRTTKVNKRSRYC